MAEEVGSAFVSLVPSARGFSARARRELRTALAGVSGQVKVRPDVDERQAAQAGRQASTLAQAAAGPVELDVQLDRRALRQAARGMATFGAVSVAGTAGLAGIAALGQGASAALVGLTAAGAGAVQVIGQLGVLLVRGAGALAAIPGAVAIAGAGVATLAVGFSGLGEALKATGEDAASFEAAIADLAPSAQDFARAVRELRPAFSELRLDVQQQLFEGLGDQFRELAEAQLPVLREGLVGVADVLNGAMAEGMRTLASESAQIRLEQIFGASQGALEGLSQAVRPLLFALLDVAAVGADVVAELAVPAGEALAGFGQMVQEMAATGELRELILGGIDALKQLGALLVDVGGIIGGFFGAAAQAGGGGIFGFLDRLNETINSVAGQDALVDIFTNLNTIGEALMPVLLALGRGLGAVGGAMADIAVETAPFLADFLDLLGDALAALAPGFIALGPAVVALGKALLPFADILSGLVVGLAPGVETFLLALGEGLELLAPAAEAVGSALGSVLSAVAPLLPVIGTQLANILIVLATLIEGIATGPLLSLLEVFGEIATQVAGLVTPILLDLAEQLLPAFADAGDRIVAALEPLVPVIADLAADFAGKWAELLPDLVDAFLGIADAFLEMPITIIESMVDLFLELAPELPSLIDSLFELVSAATDLFIALVPLLPPMAQILGLVLQLATPTTVAALATLVQLLAASFQALADGVRATLSPLGMFSDTATGETKSAVRGMERALDSTGDIGRRAGVDLGDGLRGGIRSRTQSIVDAAIATARAALKGVRGEIGARSPSTVFAKQVGVPIVQGIEVGMLRALPDLDQTLAGVTGRIQGGLALGGDVPMDAGAGGELRVVVDGTGLPRALTTWLRGAVRNQGAGSVQQFAGVNR